MKTKSISITKYQSKLAHILIVFILLNTLGFPGSYARVFGNTMQMVVEYSVFLLQIAFMLFWGTHDIMDVTLLRTKNNYFPIYIFLVVITICSMIGTKNIGEQTISCLRVCVTAFFAIWLSEQFSIEEVLTDVIWAQLFYVIFSIAFPVLFRAYDIRTNSYASDFVGISGVKNVIASELSFGILISVVLCIYVKQRQEKPQITLLVFTIIEGVLLLMTHGTGAMIITIVIVLYALLLHDKISNRLPIGFIYVVGTIGFIILALTIIPLFEPLLNALGKDATLTGRIPLWNQLISVMSSHKLLTGFGYGMFWRDSEAIQLMHAGFDANSFMGNMTSGSHNNLLELWATTGLIGVATFVWMMLKSLRKPYELFAKEKLFIYVYVLYCMMTGWTERNWGTYQYPLLFLFYILAIACTKRDKEKYAWHRKINLNNGAMI